jgi:hypothetical protein
MYVQLKNSRAFAFFGNNLENRKMTPQIISVTEVYA